VCCPIDLHSTLHSNYTSRSNYLALTSTTPCNPTCNPTALVFLLAIFLKVWILGDLLNMQSAMVRSVNSINYERIGSKLYPCGNGHLACMSIASALSALY